MYKPDALQKKAPDGQVASPSKTADVVIKKEQIDSEHIEIIKMMDNGDEARLQITVKLLSNYCLLSKLLSLGQ